MPHSTSLTNEDRAACRELARLLHEAKHTQGMTHRSLGKLLGMSDKSVSAMVNQRMRISVNTGRKLAKIFNVPLTQILPWTSEIAEESRQLMQIIELYRELDESGRRTVEAVIHTLHQQIDGLDK